MSMRENCIHEFGLILDLEGVDDLLKFYKDSNKEETKKEILDILECDGIIDLVYNCELFSKFISYGNITGTIISFETEEEKNMRGEDLLILPLKKIGLFVKYENYNDIYNEIKETLNNVGIQADLDFIKKYSGELYGTYWG